MVSRPENIELGCQQNFYFKYFFIWTSQEKNNVKYKDKVQRKVEASKLFSSKNITIYNQQLCTQSAAIPSQMEITTTMINTNVSTVQDFTLSCASVTNQSLLPVIVRIEKLGQLGFVLYFNFGWQLALKTLQIPFITSWSLK